MADRFPCRPVRPPERPGVGRCSLPHPPRQTARLLGLALVVGVVASSIAHAQTSFGRLSREQLDVLPPSARVAGTPGSMTIRETSCRSLPEAGARRRIVDIAVQEWGFFGFSVVDQTIERPAFDRRALDAARPGSRSEAEGAPPRSSRPGRRFRWLDAGEASRVAASIAGYWAVTPEGGWILENQNEAWKGPDGVAARWRDPWSAAFVSWVICESGLGDTAQFRRAVAHHAYIDQAIRARDGSAARSAFVAHDIGERLVEPGDLLCSGRRPAYRTLADRRRQMGEGARTHCDFVVKVDESAGRILAIGGNVRGTVSMKLLPAVRDANGRLHPVGDEEERATHFAHLKLRTPPVEADSFDKAPTMKAVGCSPTFEMPTRLVSARLTAGLQQAERC